MAGGGIKFNNIKISGGADGVTFIPSVDSEGNLSWQNDGGYTNPTPINIKGKDGAQGKTGAKIISQELVGKDENGGNIYEQTFDDGSKFRFTAPRGASNADIPTKTSQLYNDGEGGGYKFVTNDVTNLKFYQIDDQFAQVQRNIDKKQDILTIDSRLQNTTNPVQNRVIKAALDEKQDKLNIADTVEKHNSNPVSSKAVYEALVENKVTVEVDDALSATSTNPVQNKVIKEELDKKANVFTVDREVKKDSENPVQNKAIYQAIQNAVSVSRGIKDAVYVDLANPYLQEEGSGITLDEQGKANALRDLLREMYRAKPHDVDRLKVYFWNSRQAENQNYSYLSYFRLVQLIDNCDYYISKDIPWLLSLNVASEGLSNCRFIGITVKNETNSFFGDVNILRLKNCSNIEFIDCVFAHNKAGIVVLENCDNIRFVNCDISTPLYSEIHAIEIIDDTTIARLFSFERCNLAGHGSYRAVFTNSTNPRLYADVISCTSGGKQVIPETQFSGKIILRLYATRKDIPKKVEDLADAGSYAKKTDISTVYRYKGSKNYYSELPTEGNEVGDTYNVANAYGVYQGGTNFSWDGTTWDALGGALDLSVFVKKTDYATPTKSGVMLADDKAKLDNIEPFANNYALPIANDKRLGGIIVGDNLAVDETTGVLRGNYPRATETNDGLMPTNAYYFYSWMYANCGKSYHAYGECGWVGSNGEPNEINAAITYVRTGYGKGLISLSYILTSSNVSTDKWHISIDKVNALLAQYGIKIKKGETGNYTRGGSWVRQGEPIQTTPHTKARTCVVTPYCFLPAYYHANTEGGTSLGTVGTASFQANEIIQMWNIPVEEA